MFGLDESLASVSDGRALLVIVLVAIALGLRHATDPDHLAAVTTLLASRQDSSARAAGRLGAAWGLGHATTLVLFGLPIVLFSAYLPERAQTAAETSVGVLIAGLAVWLLIRWRRGAFNVHVHDHEHGAAVHSHLHAHGEAHAHAHGHTARSRTPLQAYGIGLIHGAGGTAGFGVLLLATIESRVVAVLALGLFAVFTAVSMAIVTAGLGHTLSRPHVRRSFGRLAPVFGMLSLVFGVWYALGAQSIVPYAF